MATDRPFTIKGLDHVVLRVADIDQSRHFYENILGCTLERELPDLGLYQLRAGNNLIDLALIGSKLGGVDPVNQSSRNQDHFCIIIDRFSEPELQAYLKDAGIKASESGDRYGAEGVGPSIYINDPDGNVIELKGKLDS